MRDEPGAVWAISPDDPVMDTGDWQRRLKARPKVWVVRDFEGNVSALYDSKQAAQLEMDYRAKRRQRGFTMEEIPLHNFELSKERWSQ